MRNSKVRKYPGSKALRVLVLEDEPDLQEAVVTYLNTEGFVADSVGSLAAANQWMNTHAFDVLILDLGLPDGSGLEWLRQHPELANKGVIIASAQGLATDRIAGAKAGADVYLVKPIALEELASVVGNLGRRLLTSEPRSWALDKLRWTLESPEGQQLKITKSEMALLAQLARQPGEVVLRSDLILGLGEDPLEYDPRRMEILVRRLRGKAQTQFGSNLPLETAHKQGYAFTASIKVNWGE